jgi:hypothetical protein
MLVADVTSIIVNDNVNGQIVGNGWLRGDPARYAVVAIAPWVAALFGLVAVIFERSYWKVVQHIRPTIILDS